MTTLRGQMARAWAAFNRLHPPHEQLVLEPEEDLWPQYEEQYEFDHTPEEVRDHNEEVHSEEG